ncbi:hypothetical protein ACFE04_016415 [Oxalis oulophora]
MAMATFQPGQQIEVLSDQDGFKGSYYGGTIMYEEEGRYFVEFHNLVSEEDPSIPHREFVQVNEIRPSPPHSQFAADFGVHTIVDAFDNDGWWVGYISRIEDNSKYHVYYELYDDEIGYPLELLRPHQEWVNGGWVIFD